jgi:hypothetical protein
VLVHQERHGVVPHAEEVRQGLFRYASKCGCFVVGDCCSCCMHATPGK